MKLKLLTLIFCLFMFSSCLKHDIMYEDPINTQIRMNCDDVFGVTFPDNNDWVSTINTSINVHCANTDENIVKVQILMSEEKDSTINMTILNEASTINNKDINIAYDVPKVLGKLFISYINDKGVCFFDEFNTNDTDIYFEKNSSKTRALTQDYVLPKNDLVIWSTEESFANQRGWLPGEVLYSPFAIEYMNANDYSESFKTIFRNVLFSYFKNGRKYNNLPLIKKSGYYNESFYPITTAGDPIIVSPVYKNDGGYHEISEADLYYYYFKGNKDLSVEELEALPKYKAIDLSTVYSNSDNNFIQKQKAYALVYWGDGIPAPRFTMGTFDFPKGYKIGFMYRSKTETDQKKKQGEVYGDGRLNYNINNYGNFKSSKLEATSPRMAWFNINDRIFLCVESGTDADFNDLILEVEGGIEDIIIPPLYEYQSYMFCFEDDRLGDYDMNDVVIKGERLNETQVRYTLMASGAKDDLYIHNVEGEHINHNIEVHNILNRPQGSFINTVEGDDCDYVSDVITVSKEFSFLDVTTQPYIYNATKDWNVKISRRGEDPHAIMIPYDFKWPLEKICIKDAYLKFNSWGRNQLIEDNDWYKTPVIENVFNK